MAERPRLEWRASLYIGKEWFLWVPAFDPHSPLGHDDLERHVVGHAVPLGGSEFAFELDENGTPRAEWVPPSGGDPWLLTLMGRGIEFVVPHDTVKGDVLPVALEAAAGVVSLLG